jgi:3-hydroxybutyryl-CoA dehydrogenase
MGCGIAESAIRVGCEVVVIESSRDAMFAAQDTLSASLGKAHERGRLAEVPSTVLARATWGEELGDLESCNVVIEAIRESFDDKARLFSDLEVVVGPQAILATNTSSIPVAKIAGATSRPERVLGLHFFNPAAVMPLVEVVPSLHTAGEATEWAVSFVRDTLGKRPIVAKDRAGFVVNAILVPYLLSAMRSLESGVASAEDIDAGLTDGCGMPMGPLRLSDMIGLDTLLLVADSLYDEYRDAANVAPPILRRHVDAGLLGRKSGRGFYDYSKHGRPSPGG